MVEAIAAVPFFTLIFASTVYISNMYGDKLHTLYTAKAGAWAYALNDCQGPNNGTTVDVNTGALADAAEQQLGGAIDQSDLNKYAQVAGGSKFLNNLGTASFTVKGTAGKLLGFLSGYKNQFVTIKVQCNEKPEVGDVLGVLKFGWNLIRFW